MRVGIFAKTFPGGTPLEVLSAARDAGYDAVQYNWACSGLGPLPTFIPETQIAAVRAASEATGVAIAAVSATYNMVHPDRPVREVGRAAFAAIAGAVQGMGSALVTVCTGSRDPQDQWRHHPDNGTPAVWVEFLAEMRLLLDIAERYGVTIGVEPETANVVCSAARAREMLDVLGHPLLGIVLDPANLFDDQTAYRGGVVVDEAIDLLADRLVLAHAKDRNPDGSFATAGAGVINMRGFVARLGRAGFDGALVTHGLTDQEAPGVARLLRECVAAA